MPRYLTWLPQTNKQTVYNHGYRQRKHKACVSSLKIALDSLSRYQQSSTTQWIKIRLIFTSLNDLIASTTVLEKRESAKSLLQELRKNSIICIHYDSQEKVNFNSIGTTSFKL